MDTERQIRQFLISTRRWNGDAEALTAEYPLLDKEVLDSMGIFELVTYLEDIFGITVEDDDLLPENFASISAITDLVARGSGT